MKRIARDGTAEFRPTLFRASLPLAFTAVFVSLLAAACVAWGGAPSWIIGTAATGSVLVFLVSFVMPFLSAVVVEPGRISGPSGYGMNTLHLERLDRVRCGIDRLGRTVLVDDLGSRLVLDAAGIRADEIDEALRIFGVDPATLGRLD